MPRKKEVAVGGLCQLSAWFAGLGRGREGGREGSMGGRHGRGKWEEEGDVRAIIMNVANDPELGARFGSSNVLSPKKLIVLVCFSCASVCNARL